MNKCSIGGINFYEFIMKKGLTCLAVSPWHAWNRVTVDPTKVFLNLFKSLYCIQVARFYYRILFLMP